MILLACLLLDYNIYVRSVICIERTYIILSLYTLVKVMSCIIYVVLLNIVSICANKELLYTMAAGLFRITREYFISIIIPHYLRKIFDIQCTQ